MVPLGCGSLVTQYDDGAATILAGLVVDVFG
jgi:hypothetical protein